MNKLLSIIFFVAIICSASHSHSGAITDSVFSGATLTSLNDITAKSSGGNPVGTIIAWPVAQNPEDMENWLECNGQTVNQAMYPELYSIIGAHVPDLRGLFLRGYGSQTHAQLNGTTVGVTSTLHESGQLGQIQGDASRKIYGATNAVNRGEISGAFSNRGAYVSMDGFNSGEILNPTYTFEFSSGFVSPTSTENRSVNMAVRYLIRALP